MGDIDISEETVDELCNRIDEWWLYQHGHLFTEAATIIRAIRTAPTASLAREAAAFEAAGEVAAVFVHERLYKAKFPACSYHHADIKAAVKALTPADAQAALQSMINAAVKEARADGMREAAAIVDNDIQKIQPEMTRRGQRLAAAKAPGFQYAQHRADLDARISCRDKILAAIPKGTDHE